MGAREMTVFIEQVEINGDGTASIFIESRRHGARTAIIDSDDAEMCFGLTWSIKRALSKKCGETFYVQTTVPREEGGRRHVALHRMITGAPDGLKVDHINRNPLDNRRTNLRVTNQTGNSHNRGDARGWTKTAHGKYRAQITANGQVVYLGHHETPQEARDAYLLAKVFMHHIETFDGGSK